MYRDENNMAQHEQTAQVNGNGSLNVSTFISNMEDTMQNVSTRDIKTGIYHDGYVQTKAGNQVPVMTILGRTGNPDFIKFVPGYTKEDGTVVNDRLSFSLLTDPEDHDLETGRRYSSYRVNAWGKQARTLKHVLLDEGPNTALIAVTNASISNYMSESDGLIRFSLNVNFHHQWNVLQLTHHNIDMGKAARALSTLSHTSQNVLAGNQPVNDDEPLFLSGMDSDSIPY